MKIFLVCNSLGGGGAERVGVNLANGFAKHNHEVYIITDIYQSTNYSVDEKITILPLYHENEGKISRWTHAVFNIRRYAKQERPDVIIGVMHLASLVSLLGCMGLHIPVVLTIHHALERIKSEQLDLPTRFFDQQVSKIYKYVAVLSQADKEFLHNRKGVFVMSNPSSFSIVDIIPQKENCLIAGGRIDSWHVKGFDVLLKAWALLMKNEELRMKNSEGRSDWWLKVAGDGKKESFDYLMGLLPDADWKPLQTSPVGRLQNIGWTSEKYRVEFLGYRTDMKELFQRASIFVLSSRSEGLPMVLIEAMSQGCAPVATDFKGRTKEILGEIGLCCAPEDVDALAVGMGRLMGDVELRERIQKNAIERSKYYHIDHIIEMWENLFRKIKV